MAELTHYETLAVNPEATQAEIKQAYRRLVKQFHPDSNPDLGHDRIASINAAYEVLGDPQRRQSYDRQLHYAAAGVGGRSRTATRQERNEAAQRQYRDRQTGQDSDKQIERWLLRIYQPVNRLLGEILKPLKSQLNDLAADPFDDELLQEFQHYLEDCRDILQRAQVLFRSMPNPAGVAGVAAPLYHCLNQVGDGIDELERFTTSYSEYYLHTGQELFRIAGQLRREAQSAAKEVKARQS